MLSRQMTGNAHQLIAMHIAAMQQTDLIAIDATLGNGFDLEFLNEQKKISKIYGFDIQKESIQVCQQKMAKTTKEVVLLHASHEHLAAYVEEGIDIALFNLGYLPGGNKEIVTQTNNSLKAIASTITKLNTGGFLAIMTYPGHEEGLREYERIKAYLHTLHINTLSVLELSVTNVNKKCPTLFIVIKQ